MLPKLLQLALIVALPTTVFGQAWDRDNNPFTIERSFSTKVGTLPLKGKLQNGNLSWPGYHWLSNLGGIAQRWSAANPQNFKYRSPSLNELKVMSANELNELSPAEKYDIFTGAYSYPTVKRVFSQVSPQDEFWEGICHGYAVASMNHPEPETVTLTNDDGITLTFYSSDVAALMAYFYAKDAPTRSKLVGKRCYADPADVGKTPNLKNCWDVNPGAFHIIMTNLMGMEGKSFIADVNRYREVWNHVAVSYDGKIISKSAPMPKSAPGTVERVLIEMNVKYAGAIAPKFDPVIGTPNAEYLNSRYVYWLDVNKDGQILGGDWQDGVQPDFIWVKESSEFGGKWAALNKIYSPHIVYFY